MLFVTRSCSNTLFVCILPGVRADTTMGAKKVWVELAKEQKRGEYTELGRVPRCQVERLMRTQCLRGRRRGRQFITTRPDSKAVRPPDLVKREFKASKPNQLWVVDFTYVATWAATAFTAFVIDVYSRRIVGWRVAGRMPTALPLDALEMALWTRQQTNELIDGLIHHSDAGSQYTSIMYTDRLIDAGALASIGTVGDSYDNAMAESTIGLYKTEMVRPEGPWRDVDHLELSLPLTMSGGSTTVASTPRSTTTPPSNTKKSTTVKPTTASRPLPDKKPSTKPGAIQHASAPTANASADTKTENSPPPSPPSPASPKPSTPPSTTSSSKAPPDDANTELANPLHQLGQLDPDDRNAILHILDGLIAKNRVRNALQTAS